MRRLLLILWLISSALLRLLCIVLAYMSLMMGAVHWDWRLSLGLGIGLLALSLGCAGGLGGCSKRAENAGAYIE